MDGLISRCGVRTLASAAGKSALALLLTAAPLVLAVARAQTVAASPQAGTAHETAIGSRGSSPGGEHLVWSEEFDQPGADLDPATWAFETGDGGWGNAELETYCSPRTTQAPCDPARQPNAFVGPDGYLHIVARRNPEGKWTSARVVTHQLESFQYGRIEARIRIPKGEGLWPAFWMLGEDIQQHPWPECGEIDIMENIGKEPALVHGTLHGPGYQGLGLGKPDRLASGKAFGDDFHTYGIVWAPGKVQFFVDDPTRPYATFTAADVPHGGTWPFDHGRFFLLLNLAVGGKWPGPPDAATPAPAEMLVDYVRVYGASASQ